VPLYFFSIKEANMSFRRDVTDLGGPDDNPVTYCSKTIAGFKAKANHNKTESQFTFAVVVLASLISPALVTLGVGYFWGKVLPACLSLGAAAATSWLQLRKPQRLWTLYRECQRRLEDQLIRHRYHLSPYNKDESRDQMLAAETAEIAMEAHQKWVGLVPNSDGMEAGLTGSAHKGDRRAKQYD
jgi:hypothetical protein